MLYVVEHLEKELFPWCIIEYRHITKIVGKKNVLFTNLRYKKDCDKIRGFARAVPGSYTTLGLKGVCVLDQTATDELTPDDKESFSAIVIGGILGTNPPQGRTKVLGPETLGFSRRNLGKAQMPTDNAAYVAQQILECGKTLAEIPTQDGLEIPLAEGESIQLPYRYALCNGKPLISGELLRHLKDHGGF